MATLTYDSRLSLQRIVTNARVHRKQDAELRTISGVFTCADDGAPEFTVLELASL
jgi:hypothetical protein